ncbi:hypothetical protein AKJ16_DCAP12229 [Drosera capensis]
MDVWGYNVLQPGLIKGIKDAPFTSICLSNIHLFGSQGPRTALWQCSDVKGAAVKRFFEIEKLVLIEESRECHSRG